MDAAVSAPLAEALDLGKVYGAKTALQNVDLSVGRGEIVGLLGPNGAGKTTLIGCLLGFLLPSAGAVRLFGETASELRPGLRGRTGFVPQTMTGFTWYRVGELINYLGRFYAQAPGEVPDWLLQWADLDMRARVKSLSGGQKQRLAIVLGMRHTPDLLILDEPVASLDPQARLDFIALLTDYCRASDRSIIISSHILSDLEKLATRAVFMRRGRIVHDVPMERFRTATRWIARSDGGSLQAMLPPSISVLGSARDSSALLVDGWDEAAAADLRARGSGELLVRSPDLETAFLEMTR